MVNGAIETVLWPGCKKTVGDDLLNGGIYANKSGYHNSRNRLKANPAWRDDYSIQLAADKLGPGDLGSAIDLTFKSAQRGNYENIAKYSRRLYEAGRDDDPRTYPMREFYGNTDADPQVEGWSYYRNEPRSSDPSHAWHIHISIYRKYINDQAAMRNILSIWNGEDDDMSISTADWARLRKIVKEEVAQVWEADVIPNVTGDATNPTIRAKNSIAELRKDTEQILKKLDS